VWEKDREIENQLQGQRWVCWPEGMLTKSARPRWKSAQGRAVLRNSHRNGNQNNECKCARLRGPSTNTKRSQVAFAVTSTTLRLETFGTLRVSCATFNRDLQYPLKSLILKRTLRRKSSNRIGVEIRGGDQRVLCFPLDFSGGKQYLEISLEFPQFFLLESSPEPE